MPDMMAHARRIAQQIAATRDQVRGLTSHWPTDGSHREELLRNLLRERLPVKCRIETGFVITSSKQSRQVDILITDSNKPVISRSADGAVFVTPDCVLAMIEVKSRLSGIKEYESALTQLAESAALCIDMPIWTGLFVHESDHRMSFFDGPDDTILAALNSVYRKTDVRLSSVSVGADLFIRFWENSAIEARGVCDAAAWHSYFMIGLAPAYFIGNFVAELSNLPEQYATVWFPIPDGKETMRRWYAPINSPPQLFPEYEMSSRVSGINDVITRAERWIDKSLLPGEKG